MINLHMHSNYSLDCKLEVNKVLDLCCENNLSYVSITDHDTCEAYKDINNTKYRGKIISGMVADALIGNETYDILCYGFDIEPVSKWAKKQYTSIAERQNKIYNELKNICQNKGIKIDESIPYNEKEEFAHAALFRMLSPKFLEKYNINSVSDLYRESTLNVEFPLYIDMSIVWPSIEQLKKVIHDNGGKIFLAHPFKYGNKDVKEVLDVALPYVDGIEIYNNNNEEEVSYLYNFARTNNLLVCAGSNFHGDENHNDINTKFITEDMENEITSWINNCSLHGVFDVAKN